jgi:hypothetical protein
MDNRGFKRQLFAGKGLRIFDRQHYSAVTGSLGPVPVGHRRSSTLKSATEGAMQKFGEIQVIPADQSETGQDEIYVIFDGKRIAKRGHPETPQARTWVSLEPGYVVLSSEDLSALVVLYNGVPVQ